MKKAPPHQYEHTPDGVRVTIGHSATGVQGVFPGNGGFIAQVGVGGRRFHLGTFHDVEEAAWVALTARVGWQP